MKLVQINTLGNMIELDEEFNLKNIRKMMRNISKVKKILHLYNWSYENSTIQCFGCLDGKPGKENKHDLPPNGIKLIDTIDNSDKQLLFNDIFLVRVENKKYLNLDISEYGLFYNICFDGFDDCHSEYSNENNSDDNNSINEFIINDEYNESDEDYILDEDYNEY